MSLATITSASASDQGQLAYKPLQIANIPIGLPVVQAALSGYSDWAMRVLARRMGAPYTLCEVMLDQFINDHSHFKKNASRVPSRPTSIPSADS